MYSYDRGFSLLNHSYGKTVLQKSHADGISLFLFDRSDEAKVPCTFLYSRDNRDCIVDTYSKYIYKDDPLLPHKFSPKEKYRSFAGLNTPQTRPYKIDVGIKGGEYWKYFIDNGYCELASIYQAVSKDLFVVIGMHTETNKRHIDLDSTGQKMEYWLSEASNYLIEYSIRQQSLTNTSLQEPDNGTGISEILTKSEYQVAYELLRGKCNKEIARDANLTEYAVENHLRRMYRKLSVRNRTALILKLNSL